jgi:hypothetical protein
MFRRACVSWLLGKPSFQNCCTQKECFVYGGAVSSDLQASYLNLNSCRDLPRIEAADNYTMAAAEGRAAWQRTNRHLNQEDSVRAPKLSHCPSLSKGQAEFCHPSAGRAVENIPSFYSTNSWGSSDSKIDAQWQQLNSSAQHHDYRSEYFGLDDVLGSRFKSAGLQALAVECSNVKGGTAGQCFIFL